MVDVEFGFGGDGDGDGDGMDWTEMVCYGMER